MIWYRVFTRSAASIQPAIVLAGLVYDGAPVQGQFQADEHGWFRCELVVAAGALPIALECFRVFEEGVRPEVLSWAAYVETIDSPHSVELMELLNAASQVFTVQQADVRTADLLKGLCLNLARAGDGVYQIDGEGFFWPNGARAIGEVE
jgi:hypothetical protein